MLSASPTLFSSDAIPTDEKKAAAREFAICDSTVKYLRRNVLTRQEALPFTGKAPSVFSPEAAIYSKEVDEKFVPLVNYMNTSRSVISAAIEQGKTKGITSTSTNGNLSSCLLINLCGAGDNIDIARATQMQLYQSGIKTVTFVSLFSPDSSSNHQFYTFILPGIYEIGAKVHQDKRGFTVDTSLQFPIKTLLTLPGDPIIADAYLFEGARFLKKNASKLMEFAQAHRFDTCTTIVVDDAPEQAELFYRDLETAHKILKPVLLQTYKDKILANLAAITGIQWKAPSTFTADKPCAFWIDTGDLEKARAELLAKGIPENQLKIVPWPAKGTNFLQISPLGIGLLALVVGMVPKASLKKEKTPEEKKKKETPSAPPTASRAPAAFSSPAP